MARSPNKKLKDKCDKLWADIIKARAEYTCELTGVDSQVAAHHIAGKPNYALRYNLRNGICLDNYKMHIWGVHNKNNPATAYNVQQKIINYIGDKQWEHLIALGWMPSDEKLADVEIRLERELAKYE